MTREFNLRVFTTLFHSLLFLFTATLRQFVPSLFSYFFLPFPSSQYLLVTYCHSIRFFLSLLNCFCSHTVHKCFSVPSPLLSTLPVSSTFVQLSNDTIFYSHVSLSPSLSRASPPRPLLTLCRPLIDIVTLSPSV